MAIRHHPEIIVEARRGGTVESVHRAVAALVGPDGVIIERWGDPDVVTFWRSSAKPFQAQAWVADGTVARFGWGPEQLAIMSASHEGLDVHADLVRAMLADLGLSEADLRCGGLTARHACSGNHTGYLAASVNHGWDISSYPELGHPAQEAALNMFAACVGLDPREIPLGIDGCGVVCYATPVTIAAATFARVPEILPGISAAMRAHPTLVEGPGLLDTVCMEVLPGATSKCGAEGLSCISLPDGLGLAVKVLDGAERACQPATLAALSAILDPNALDERLTSLGRQPIKNDLGDVVGELVAVAPD